MEGKGKREDAETKRIKKRKQACGRREKEKEI